MAEHLNALACLIVEDLHGTFLSHMFEQLAYYGRLPSSQIAQRCHLPIKQAKSGLAVLVQLRLVQHHTTGGGFSTFQANVNAAYDLLRIGKLTALAERKFGPVAASLIDQLALNGYSTASQAVEHVNEGLAPANQISQAKVNRAFQSLTAHGFTRKVRSTHFKILHDVEDELDNDIAERKGNPKTRSKKFQQEVDAQVKIEVEQLLDPHLAPGTFDDDYQNATRDFSKPQVKDDFYISVNFDAAVRDTQQSFVLQAAEKALGKQSGKIAQAVVAQVAPRPSVPDRPADALTAPSIQMLILSNIRQAYQDIDQHYTSNGVNGTNGHHNDVVMTNGVDDSQDNDLGRSSLENSLSLIAEGPFPFLIRDAITSSWNLDTITLTRWLRDKEIDRIILHKVGPVGLRVKRMLQDKGKMDEKNIQEIGLLVAKELRQTLANLQSHGLIELQEVPREPQRQPNRTMYFWFFDAERAKTVLLGDLYKSMARLYEVLKREREGSMKNTLEKLARLGGEQKPEDYLGDEEMIVYKQWRRKELWLIAEIERLDESVALLRDS